jgi:hypothetical protein
MEKILFVTAQPDVPYFIWQIKLYVHNFIEKGINPSQIHVVLGIIDRNTEPSEESLELKKFGIHVHHFKDDRRKKHYIPSVKPFLISKWLQLNESYGEIFFLHDADIIFRELPSFDRLLNDNITYLSNTVGYIGYNYIIDCCNRYETHHPKSEKGQLISEMANVIGIDVETIKSNQENSGGGQYLIKNTNPELWDKIYNDSNKLYDQMHDYHRRFPISPGEIQFWTAEMWSVLWNLWLYGKETKITSELDFSWATDSVSIYESKPILHMAGVTDDLKNKKFYKGEFINIDPIERIKDDPNYFDFIESTSSTVKYIDNMKSFIKKYES